MKIAILVSLAKQVEGEFTFLNIIKAHKEPHKVREYLEKTDLPKTTVIGGVDCVIEYGIFDDVDVEE